MTLIEKIKEDQIAARKAHDSVKASLLTTLLGEATAIGKNNGNREVTDAEVVALVKKFMKGVDETINALTMHNKDATQFLTERGILETYLPKQLTQEETESALKAAIAEVGANMGKVMGYMKANYEGQYDGKLASTIVKTLL